MMVFNLLGLLIANLIDIYFFHKKFKYFSVYQFRLNQN